MMHRCLLILWLLLFTPVAWAGPSAPNLAKEMGVRIERVPEFEFIREEAKKLGVRVYLFGGTAAAYGHYVRQDMAREAGDTRYPEHLYDYDYTNIFRSTQDLDVVIDGPANKAAELEAALKKKFPHFVGDKAAKWEVRSLREARGDKEPLLGNPDFQNQHTDSHSTGLVEITETPGGESPVKDVRDWESKRPQFLTDVAENKLHYYFSPKHGTTARAKQGMNPPILSAIRYLTKAFQYDLEISGEDRKKIQEVIRAFDPNSVGKGYVKDWTEKNGKKLFQHAVDIEYAWNQLENLGLRKKLVEIQNNPGTQDSLAWWMNKEPLRTKPVGGGDGKTAAEIFGKDLTFAHETNSFLAYESITRSKAGELNGLISRENAVGEAAALGDGFYARRGRKGARGTGITIRMELDPKAREGMDFILSGDVIVLKNKAAVKVKQEQIELSILEYLKLLGNGREFSADDKALFEAFKRRIRRSGLISARDQKEIVQYMNDSLGTHAGAKGPLWGEWFSLPLSQKHPEITDALVERGDAVIAASYMHWPQAQSDPKFVDWVGALAKRGGGDYYLSHLLLHPRLVNDSRWGDWIDVMAKRGEKHSDLVSIVLPSSQAMSHPNWADWVDAAMKNANRPALAKDLLSRPEVMRRPRFGAWMDLFLQGDSGLGNYIEHVLSKPEAVSHPKWKEWVGSLMKRRDMDGAIAQFILPNPAAAALPEWGGWVETLLNRGSVNSQMISGALKQAQAMDHPKWHKWVSGLYRQYAETNEMTAAKIVAEPYVANHPEWTGWMDRTLKLDPNISYVVRRSLGSAEAVKHPKWAEWLKFTIDRGDPIGDIAYNVLAKPETMKHPEWEKMLGLLLKEDKAGYSVAQYILTRPEILAKPIWEKWVNALMESGGDDAMARYLLPDPQVKKHPRWGDVLDSLIRRGKATDEIVKNVLTEPYPPKLAEAMKKNGMKTLTADGLKKLVGAGLTFGQGVKIPASCGAAFAGLSP